MLHVRRLGVTAVRVFHFYTVGYLIDFSYVCVWLALIVCYRFFRSIGEAIFALWQLTWIIAHLSWGARKQSVCLHDVYPYWFHLTSKYVFLCCNIHLLRCKKSHCLHHNVHCSKSICLFVTELRNQLLASPLAIFFHFYTISYRAFILINALGKVQENQSK